MSSTSRTVAGLLMLASAGLIAGCSQTDPGNEPGDPDFTACDPEETVPLDSVESRNSHPKFSILGMQDIGDPLPAMDHAIVVDESSVLHCFWTRGRDWQHGTSTNFGHASSSDMVSWTTYPHVTLVSSAYEIDRVWAPQVIREDSNWHMYFTGVEIFADDAENIQRILTRWCSAMMEP
jgi:hypothetical protein